MSRLVQVAKRAADSQASTAFFSLLLQRPPVAAFDPPGFAFFDLEGVRLLLSPTAPPATVYVEVADLDAGVRRLDAAGVAIDTAPHRVFDHDDDALGPAGTAEWQAFVLDPDGDLVGLVEHRRR